MVQQQEEKKPDKLGPEVSRLEALIADLKNDVKRRALQSEVNKINERLNHFIEDRTYKRDTMRIDSQLEGHSHQLEEHQHASGELRKEID